MGINKEDLERSRREEEYRLFLAESRRRAAEENNEAIQGLVQELNKVRQRYHQAERDFKESTHERNRIHSTESVSAIIASFGDSLKAMGGMKLALEEIVVRKAWMMVYKTASNPEAAPLLTAAADMLRQAPRATRQFLDNRLGTNIEGYFQEPLPPVIIPYLAEVDNNGVLTCNLTENEQLHKDDAAGIDDRQKFIRQYQDDFKRAIVSGMREARDVDNQPMYHVDDTTNPAAPVITHAVSGEPLTSEEFAEFRETVLTQKLTQEFGEEFRAEGPAAQRSPGA